MKKCLRWLVCRADHGYNPIQMIIWWEIRRIPYNFIVGVIGILSIILFFIFVDKAGHLIPGEDPIEPVMILGAPIIINICYTLGWIVEIILWLFKLRNPKIGPYLFTGGTLFSISLISLPAIMGGLVLLGFISP